MTRAWGDWSHTRAPGLVSACVRRPRSSAAHPPLSEESCSEVLTEEGKRSGPCRLSGGEVRPSLAVLLAEESVTGARVHLFFERNPGGAERGVGGGDRGVHPRVILAM